jgi:hypothetical protein
MADHSTTRWVLAAAVVGLAWLAAGDAEARVPRPKKAGGYGQIWDLARIVEQRAQMPGFAKFALAVAKNESRGNNLALNDSTSERNAACRGYDNNLSKYGNNPYGRDRFCFGSGGWFGFLPSTALSAPSFRNEDPYLVFDPAASVALLADYIWRVKKGFFNKLPTSCQNWLTVRRFMASNSVGLDCDETNYDRSAVVRERFSRDLKYHGYNPNFMYQSVTIGDWPGDWDLYQTLRGFEGATAPPLLEDEIPRTLGERV